MNVKRTRFLFIIAISFLLCIGSFLGIRENSTQVKAEGSTFSFNATMETEYALGEKIVLPLAQCSGEYNVFILKDGRVMDKLFGGDIYALNATGSYEVIYTVEDESGYVRSDGFSFTCVEKPYISIPNISSSIKVFDSLDVSGAKLVKGGVEVADANVSLIDPDGISQDVHGLFKPTKTGVYKLIFTAANEGVNYSKEVEVTVFVRSEDLFENINSISVIESGVDYPDWVKKYPTTEHDDIKGVMLLGKGGSSSFRYRNVIDLNELERGENLIKFVVLYGEGYAEFSLYDSIYVSLIDVYDSKNKVSIKIQPSRDSLSYSYITVSPDGNNYYGRSNESAARPLRKNSANGFGFVTTAGVRGLGGSYEFGYDVSTNEVLSYNGISWQAKYQDVIDLDDSTYMGGDVFKGFKTGEVYLQVDYPALASKGGVIVSEIAGQTFSSDTIDDSEAPYIYVDTKDTNNLPMAYVNRPYELPSFRAYDLISGEVNASAKLYHNGEEVPLGGDFVPAEAGEYKYVITAKDCFGNREDVELSITVLGEKNPIKAQFDEELSQFYAGSKQKLPRFSCFGGVGDVTYDYKLLLDGREIYEDENGFITPELPGTLEIAIVAQDYLGDEASLTLSFEILVPQKAIVKVNGIPDAVKVGDVLSFENFQVLDYLNGVKVEKPYSAIYVNGVKSEKYTVKETDGEFLNVEFVGGRGDRQTVVLKKIKVINSTELKDYYLTSEGTEIEVSENGSLFSSDKDFTLKYPFGLAASELLITAGISLKNAKSIDLILEDYIDSNVKICLTFTYLNEDKVNMQICGDERTYLVKGSLGDISEQISIIFKNSKLMIYEETGAEIAVVKYDMYGNSFKGFASGKVRLSFEITGATGTNELLLYKVCNQVLDNNALSIGVAPIVSFENEMKNIRIAKGEEFYVSKAMAIDALDNVSTVYVSMKDPKGNNILMYDKCDITRYFKTEENGIYKIVYDISDSSGNSRTVTYNVICVDDQAPTITVSQLSKLTYKVGEKLVIPNVSVVDNIDQSIEIFIYFEKIEDMTVQKVAVGKEIVLEDIGKYKIIIFAYDSNYNISRTTIEIVVEPAEEE